MTQLKPAVIPESESRITIESALKQWRDGIAEIRQALNANTEAEARAKLESVCLDESRKLIFLNDTYQVAMRKSVGGMVHLSIKRIDRAPIHDWRDIQEIKNQLVGPECEAVELYPAESRRVDTANQYHIWCITDRKYRFPFGFDEGRIVTDIPIGKSVNRKLKP